MPLCPMSVLGAQFMQEPLGTLGIWFSIYFSITEGVFWGGILVSLWHLGASGSAAS